MICFLLILVTVCAALEPQDGMYVWGPSVLSEEDAVSLRLDSQLDFSFIRVGYAERELFIDLVRRGNTWAPKVQFCATMLPAVIRDFVASIGLDMTKDVDRMSVVNAAKPRKRGCECYIKTMRAFGFTVINGKTDATDHCTNENDESPGDQFVGTPGEDGVKVGESTPAHLELVKSTTNKHIYEPKIPLLQMFT